MGRLWRGLTRNRARTDPRSDDPALRGRTYAIPFDDVWRASLALADGGLPRWTVTHADDADGVIEAESKTLVFRLVDDVRIDITLDENAQTRVDVQSGSRRGFGDLGKNRRRIRRFIRELDDRLEAEPGQILRPGQVLPIAIL